MELEVNKTREDDGEKDVVEVTAVEDEAAVVRSEASTGSWRIKKVVIVVIGLDQTREQPEIPHDLSLLRATLTAR